MKKCSCMASLAVLVIIFITISTPSYADEFQYPTYLIGSFNSYSDCWYGIDEYGTSPAIVDPNKYLVGPPPSIDNSSVTLPEGSWVELYFSGIIFDGLKEDIFISEIDPMGEEALVFLTDGGEQEYLLASVGVPDTGVPDNQGHLRTIIGIDLAGVVLPFEPRAIRIVGIDLQGGSPGFDLSYVNARVYQDENPKATYPFPPDKAENVPVHSELSWLGGNYSQIYSVHLGQDISSVYPDADTIQPQMENSFDPITLEMGKTYHWRVDQVNEVDPNIILTGTPWSFTVADSLVIDDFETYSLGNPIENKWTIGIGSRPRVILSSLPGTVHKCRQSMKLEYYCSQTSKTLASYTFEKPQDWKAAGVKTIDLYFLGRNDNHTECKMYVELSDGEKEYRLIYDDVNNIALDTWQLWRINLQSLGFCGEDINEFDTSHIVSFSIGVEIDPNTTSPYRYGTIHFDDITLYPSRCLPGTKPEGDFNGDCIVDFIDFCELAYNWLESGYNIYQVQQPKNSPLFWYKFDNNLYDTSGNADAEFEAGSFGYEQGIYGQAINFNAPNTSIVVDHISDIIYQIDKGITISFWQKGEISKYKRDTLFCTEYIYNVSDPAISINLGCWDKTGIYNWDCGTHLPYDRRLSGTHRYKEEWANQWNHWAFTKDMETGIMQVYLNGALINSRSNSSNTISSFDSFTVGSGWYGDYDGLMDDLRIYDYALSQPEIAYVATNGSGILDVPLMTPADLHPDNTIDFNDFIIFADHWLEDLLYPCD